MRLEIDNATVGYDGRPVLAGATLGLAQGEIGCLLGPSGAGKTTLLRAVAGFEPLMGGRISANGEVLVDGRIHLPPERRRIGMVFQDHALLPHLSVLVIVRFVLYREPRLYYDALVHEVLDLDGLTDVARTD